MRSFIALLLAAALTCGTVYLYLKSAAASNRVAATPGTSAPSATMERAKHAAKEIEQSTQVRIDDLAKKTQ
jgi:hypothetical protein